MAVQTPPRMTGGSAKTQNIIIPNFSGGVNSYLDEARLPNNTLRSAVNYMLRQDGVLYPRWGTKTFFPVLDKMPDGFDKFTVKMLATASGLEEWAIIVEDGVVKRSNGGAWQEATGEKLTPGYEAKFYQVDDCVYIVNGKDVLAFYDIANNKVKKFEGIDTPKNLKVTNSKNLATGSYSNFYKVSAVNEVGETMASAEISVKTSRIRNQWRQTGEVEDYLELTWDAVPKATRYNIYYSDMSNDETYIDSVSTNSYRDLGRTAQNVAVEAPVADTTSGPVLRDITGSSYRIFGVGVDDKVYWGGVGKYISAFNAFYGGGWVEINKGTGEIPITVRSYRDGRGEPVNVVFMTTASGEGSQNQLTLTSMTVGNTSFIVPNIARVVGSYGTYAAGSVTEADNNLFFTCSRGKNTTGAKPDLLNVLSTEEVSLAICPDFDGINPLYGREISSVHFDGKIFDAVPAAQSKVNNEIWILDLQLKAWIRPWTIGIKKLITFTPSDGRERLMGLRSTPDNNGKYRIVEFSEKYITDDGEPFVSTFRTGLLHFDKGHMSWAKMKKTYIELLRVSGSLSITVSGTGKKRVLHTLKDITVSSAMVTTGFNSDKFNDFAFNDTEGGHVTFSDPSTKKSLKINKVVNNYRVDGRSSNASYGIATITSVVIPKKVPDPASWKK